MKRETCYRQAADLRPIKLGARCKVATIKTGRVAHYAQTITLTRPVVATGLGFATRHRPKLIRNCGLLRVIGWTYLSSDLGIIWHQNFHRSTRMHSILVYSAISFGCVKL